VTIVELLVVIAIITILIGLLLVAIQQSRAVVRRLSCANNLRQLALAVNVYDAAQQRLPPVLRGYRDTQKRWATHPVKSAILAQLEQQSLLDALDTSKHVADPTNQRVITQVLGVYLCPATPARLPQANPAPSNQFRGLQRDGVNDSSVTAALCDYTPNTGYRRTPSIEPRDGPGIWSQFKSAPTSLAAVPDGLSATVMWAEQAGRPDRHFNAVEPYQAGVESYDGWEGNYLPGMDAGWAIGTAQVIMDNPTVTSPQHINICNSWTLFGFHAGGVNVAMADGSSRFLGNEIDGAVLFALMVSDDGGKAE